MSQTCRADWFSSAFGLRSGRVEGPDGAPTPAHVNDDAPTVIDRDVEAVKISPFPVEAFAEHVVDGAIAIFPKEEGCAGGGAIEL